MTPLFDLTGQVEEFNALQAQLIEAPRILVIAAPPRSGTSRLLAHFDRDAASTLIVADARACSNVTDLAMAIGDAAVRELAPDALGWWTSGSHPREANALRLSRALSDYGVDLDDLRLGAGHESQLLADALRLARRLLDGGTGGVVIDHMGEFLAGVSADASRRLLGDLRNLLQQKDTAALVVVEPPAGPFATALNDPDHPLYFAGRVFELQRPDPARFVTDLAITRGLLPDGITPPLIGAAAELAQGVPDLVWQTVRLAPRDREPKAAAAAAWTSLREANAASLAAYWSALRRVHPQAQLVVGALAFDHPPTTVATNPRSAADALERLKLLGAVWQPRPRRWALADPLLASWLRQHGPPWALRARRVGVRGGGALSATGGGSAEATGGV